MAADLRGHKLRAAVDIARDPDRMLRQRFALQPLPPGWKFYMAADTGTYMSAVFIAFPPDSMDAFVLEEFPNYRYVGGEIELLGYSIPEWARDVVECWRRYVPGKTKLKGLCDENSQFKHELRNYDIHLRGNPIKLETRVEISREYFQNQRIHLAPWLAVLPYELEHAVWPDDTNSAGRFERLKEQDHSLDGVEHILSQRPRNKAITKQKQESFTERFLRENRWADRLGPRNDPHLGSI